MKSSIEILARLARSLGDRFLRGVNAAARRPVAVLGGATAAAFLTLCLVARVILRAFPNSGDEYGYLFLAKTLAAGRIWSRPPPLPDFFFQMNYVVIKAGKRFSRYPPGWPMVLALGQRLKIPSWLVDPVVGVLQLPALFFFGRRTHGDKAALTAVLVTAVSPFFLFNAGSYFSHSFCALLLIVFFHCCSRLEEGPSPAQGLLAGVLLGWAFVTRYYTALLCALPPMLFLARRKGARGLVDWLWIAAGAAPFVAALLSYNAAITGRPLLMVTTWVDPTEKLGFQAGYGPFKAALYLGQYALEFAGWASPALPALFLFGFARSWRRRTLTAVELVVPALVFGYLFWSRSAGNRYGPRFYYEAFPFLALAIGAWLFDERRGILGADEKPVFAGILSLGLFFCLGVTPWLARRERRVVTERSEIYRLVEEAGLSRAVVIVVTDSGGSRPMYPRDLVRNGDDPDQSVLFVNDFGRRNRELKAAYPDRRFYAYYHRPGAARGFLSRWRL